MSPARQYTPKSLDGTVLTWNRAAARLTGLEPAEVIGRSHALFRSPVEVQRIEAAMAQLAAIVEASEDAMFSVSRAHVVESWNSGCARLFALRPWLALLRPLDSLFPRQDCEALAAMIDRTIAGETVRNVDWPFADGRTGPAAAAGSGSAPSGTSPAAHWTVSMRPIQGRGGEVCSVAVIVRDVTSERAATAALDEERRFVRAVLDTLPIGVSVRDVLGQVLLANTRFDDLHAQGRPSAVGTSYADRVRDPAEIDLLMRTDREVLRTGRPAEYERRITAADGSVRDVQVMKMPIRVAGELRILAASVDITARRRAESELQREREFMRTEIDTDPTLIYVRDASGRFLLANRAVAASLGFRVSAVEGQRLADLLADPVRSAEYSTHDAEMLRLRRPITREECHRDASGNERWFSSTRLPLTGADGAVVVLGVSTEVTEIRRQAQRIHELTHYDPLTGLPNRLLIEDLLQVALARAERDRTPVAVMFVDLDHFKTVNDSLGHPVGDRLLVAVSDRMRAALRDVDSIGRLGGDEFLIVLAQIERGDAVALVAQKPLKVLEESFDVQGHSLSVNASIGIAMYPDDGTTPHVLVQNADTAMYHAKEQGRAGYRFFTQELNARAARSLAIEHGIRRGLREGEFELWYQPVHATADGTVAAMEALIRWRRSSGDLWGPGEFIGVAEERGQIVHLGRWVLRAACAFVAGRRAAGLAPIPVAINLSPAELRQPGLVGQVARALDEFGLPPSAIEFEVTENSIMHDIGAAIEVLRGLRALGVVVAVDDFGTGHSSLAWLRQLPIDKLKIDRAFVANVPASEPDAAIFAAIVTMARALGIRTVAEGIETPAQFERVRALGCDLAQGYLLSRPLPEAQVSARVDTGARPPAARLP